MALVNGVGSVIKTTAAGVVTPLAVLTISDGQSSAVFFETKFMDLEQFTVQEGDPTKIKFISGVALEMEERQPVFLQLSVGTKENINDVPAWAGPYDVKVGEVFPLRLRTRYLAFRVTDTRADFVWQLTAIEVYGRLGRGGQRR